MFTTIACRCTRADTGDGVGGGRARHETGQASPGGTEAPDVNSRLVGLQALVRESGRELLLLVPRELHLPGGERAPEAAGTARDNDAWVSSQ